MRQGKRILFVGISAAVMLFALCLRKDFAAGRMEPISIAAATDLHYIAPELTDHGSYFQQVIRNADGKAMEYCEELTEAFVQQVISQSPDLLILSGDLTFNGARASHEALAAKLEQIEEAGIPVLVIPGNHDLENFMAASFHGDSYTLVDSVTEEEFAEIYGKFGYQEAIARDDASLSYVAEAGGGLWILMLDVNTVRSPGTLTDDTLAWAEQQLQNARRRGVRVLAVSHQNILEHNHLFPFGFVMGNHKKLLELYEKYHVICNLSGHMHVQHIMESEKGFPEIAASCLAEWPNQYGILTLGSVPEEDRAGVCESEENCVDVYGPETGICESEKNRTDVYGSEENGTGICESEENCADVCEPAEYHTVFVDVSAANQESSDPDLRNFPAYAHAFLWDTAYRQAGTEMGDDARGKELKRFFADVNTAYIAGCMDEADWNEEFYQAWKKDAAFLYAYLQSIADDGFRNYTEYTFSFS